MQAMTALFFLTSEAPKATPSLGLTFQRLELLCEVPHFNAQVLQLLQVEALFLPRRGRRGRAAGLHKVRLTTKDKG